MTNITQFSASTIEAIKSYVYVLTDENDQVFYVGKGNGNRVFAHVNEVRELMQKGASLSDESAEADDNDTGTRLDPIGPKRQQIASMLRLGRQPGMFIVRDCLTDGEALLIESVLIDIIDWQLGGKLTNAVSGHGASAFGLKPVAELEATKGQSFRVSDLPDLGSAKEVVAINVNRRYSAVESGKSTLLDIAKGYWKLGLTRAQACPYAVIHARGIVRGVFRLKGWKSSSEMLGRYEFVPAGAEPLVGEAFSNRNVGGLFDGAGIGSQNPVRYIPVAGTTV